MAYFPEERRSSLNWWLGALGVAAVGLVGWAYLGLGAGPEATDMVAEAAVLTPEDAAAAAPPVETAAAPPSPVARPVRRPRAPAQPSALPLTGSPGVELLASVSSANGRVKLGPMPGNLIPPVAAPAPVRDPAIYDLTSGDVVPPQLVQPVVSAPLDRKLSGSSMGSATVVVIVGDDGQVESVRASSEPATLSDALNMYNALSIANFRIGSDFGRVWLNAPPV
jgi:hypothetical protein